MLKIRFFPYSSSVLREKKETDKSLVHIAEKSMHELGDI